eukprot:TRINITY_DN475_c0_g1_i1.p1 TRINITY_DN475_c0_g1~~TRINITY_DN475_c0_g1_i1.p1  ORF type:complete len:309 (+),score=46.18 TRINITY_DN475_c0_g1_i1:92-1018(+)
MPAVKVNAAVLLKAKCITASTTKACCTKVLIAAKALKVPLIIKTAPAAAIVIVLLDPRVRDWLRINGTKTAFSIAARTIDHESSAIEAARGTDKQDGENVTIDHKSSATEAARGTDKQDGENVTIDHKSSATEAARGTVTAGEKSDEADNHKTRASFSRGLFHAFGMGVLIGGGSTLMCVMIQSLYTGDPITSEENKMRVTNGMKFGAMSGIGRFIFSWMLQSLGYTAAAMSAAGPIVTGVIGVSSCVYGMSHGDPTASPGKMGMHIFTAVVVGYAAYFSPSGIMSAVIPGCAAIGCATLKTCLAPAI